MSSEIAKWVKELTAKSHTLSSDPRTYTVKTRTDSYKLSFVLHIPTMVHTYTSTHKQ